jgi:hypothetical protein
MKLHDKKAAVQLYSVSKLNTILSQLEYVRKSGDGHIAKCPVHGGDNKSTLSVNESKQNPGNILLRCHAEQCSYKDIMASLGLPESYLFPDSFTHHAPPEQRRKWKHDRTHREWAEFARDFILECRVVWVAGKQIRNGQPLNDEENTRLDSAMKRISNIGDLFNGIT